MSLIGSIIDWRTYAAARGDDAPAGASDELATEALQRATDYIRHAYVSRFVSPYSESSDYVEEATYEAANKELATVGFWTKTFTEDQQKVLVGVDTIKWSPIKSTSLDSAGQIATPRSTLIDNMLNRYLPDAKRLGPYIKTIGATSE